MTATLEFAVLLIILEMFSIITQPELSTGRVYQRVGSGRVGSGRVGSVGSGRVGSGHNFGGFWRVGSGRVGSALRIFLVFY